MKKHRYTGMKDAKGNKIYEGDTVAMRWGAWMEDGKLVPDIRYHKVTFWQENSQMGWHLDKGCFNRWKGSDVVLVNEES